MRVISGVLKGRRFDAPKGFKSRPTTDFARESLFNILSHRVDFEELDVLDLFSGTGGVTYEFASRGVRTVTGIEKSNPNVKHIRNQVKAFELSNVLMHTKDAFHFLKTTDRTFDLIFADPPFEMKGLISIPDEVFKGEILAKDGLLVIEHPQEIKFDQHPNFEEHRKYGQVNFSFFRYLVQ